MLVEYNKYRSDGSEAVWSHRRRSKHRLVYILIRIREGGICVMSSSISRSGVVALLASCVYGLCSSTLAQRKPDSAKTLQWTIRVSTFLRTAD
jgi:hypothetical protein